MRSSPHQARPQVVVPVDELTVVLGLLDLLASDDRVESDVRELAARSIERLRVRIADSIDEVDATG
jgi:hypothetical protein